MWHRKSQVGWHNSGILLADQYQMHGLPQSFQHTLLLILGCNSTAFQHTSFWGQLLKYHSKPSKEIEPRPSMIPHHEKDTSCLQLSITSLVLLLQRKNFSKGSTSVHKNVKHSSSYRSYTARLLTSKMRSTRTGNLAAVLHSFTFIECWICCQSGLSLCCKPFTEL